MLAPFPSHLISMISKTVVHGLITNSQPLII
uniref:Uncharacterized protein n=1 Tax=Arundo donax TaxID=35708 RepID=A0A0A9B4A3_ARUDO